MRVAEGRIRFGGGFGPAKYVATLAAVLVLAVALLVVFPTRALAAPDLSIRKDGPSRVEPEARFDYVLTVTNKGEDPATNVKVEDELPAGVTFEKAKVSAGVTCPSPPAGTVTCDIANLEAGESKQIILTVIAPANAGVIENEARASIVGDPDSVRVSNKVTTTVAPRLVITKLAEPDPVRTRAILTYTLRVENTSETTANGVSIRDELPLDRVDFSSVDSGDFDCKYTAGIIRCNDGIIGPNEVGKVEIAVKTDKAGPLQNRADVFVDGIRESLGSDTVKTRVGGTGGGGGGGGGGNPGGLPVPTGDQCTPVTDRATGEPAEVVSGIDPVEGTFKNEYSSPLPLRIAYATSSEDGSLTITLTRKGNGRTILDETINGKKRGVLEVRTEAGATYDVVILPDNQGYAVDLQIGRGEEPCTNPEDLDPPDISGGDDNDNNGNNGGNGNNDVVDGTISNNPLPSTGGPSLLGLAVVSLGIAAVGGATVVRTGVRRRDR